MSEPLAINNLKIIEELHHGIIALKMKLNELITKVNFISMYYESKGDYAGALLEVE